MTTPIDKKDTSDQETSRGADWTRLSVLVPAAAEEPVTAAFSREDAAARAGAIVVEDHTVGILATAETPPEGSIRVSIYVAAVEADAVAQTLRARLGILAEYDILDGVPTIERQAVESEDWRNRWKDYFHVTRVTDRIVIRPPWREYEPQEGDVVLEVEPGMAFGTGGHQTTQLCLKALQAAIERSGELADMLDVGCGSGVLAIAALRLGVGRAVGIDVDAPAVEATEDNARRNGVLDRVQVSQRPLDEVARERDYPLVVANIISGTLLSLRDGLLQATRSGGLLVLSGLLAYEEESFREEFEAGTTGLSFVSREEMDEWLSLTYRVER